jgi:hypothetical protein
MESVRPLDQGDMAPGNMDFETRLFGLESLILELLIKNQQLRDRLYEQELEPRARSAKAFPGWV